MIESAARRLASELVDRRESINRELSRNGVRFGIYKNGEYHDRLFPYDPIPRIIESDEFDRMEAGLKQRVNALNAYLRDIYSDKQAIKDGIVPEEYVYTSAGYFPQVNGVTPPGGVFAHVAGEDLVQGQDGQWWVLEDNLRIPSGASYPLFARDIERRITPSLFRNVRVRDNRDYPRLLRQSMDFVSTDGIAVVLTPRQVQFRVLRTCIPGRENRRGARVPRRPRSRGQQSVLPRLCRQETPRRRGLPPSVRRISRPVRVQPGFRGRRAGNPIRLQVGQCGDRQRSGQRRGRRQGHLLFRAEHDPLLSRRRADSAQCADLHADVRQGPQGGTRPARRTGHQGCGGSGRLRRRVRLVARPVAARGTGRTHQGRTAPVHRAGGHPIQGHRRGGPRNRTDEPT